jgi:hypothetical protein
MLTPRGAASRVDAYDERCTLDFPASTPCTRDSQTAPHEVLVYLTSVRGHRQYLAHGLVHLFVGDGVYRVAPLWPTLPVGDGVNAYAELLG